MWLTLTSLFLYQCYSDDIATLSQVVRGMGLFQLLEFVQPIRGHSSPVKKIVWTSNHIRDGMQTVAGKYIHPLIPA